MNLTKHLLSFKKNLISFIHLQLFISLISLPVLLCWGIPFSVLSFVGNFIFAPVLTAFLLLSSLIFFCQLLGIPNGIFIYFLQKLNSGWMFFMQTADNGALVGFARPPLFVLIMIAVAAAGILHWKKINTPLKGIVCYSALFAIIIIYLKLCTVPATIVESIDCNNKKVPLVVCDNRVAVIDNHVIGARPSAASWLEYTLTSAMIKTGGYTSIDHFVLPYPSKIMFEALTLYLEKITIKNIYIAIWDGRIPKHHWRSYKRLTSLAQKKNCKITRISSYKSTKITLTPDSYITVTPTKKLVKKVDFSYPKFKISAVIKGDPALFLP